MNWRKVIAAGLAVDVTSVVLPATSYAVFSWVFRVPPTDIWRWTPDIPITAMPVRWLIFIIIANTVLCLYFAFLYAFFFDILPSAGVKKGIIF